MIPDHVLAGNRDSGFFVRLRSASNRREGGSYVEYRPLGASGLQVSVVGLGANTFGRTVPDPADAAAILHRALDLGITFVDTADSYNNGVSEELIGRALGDRRREVVIATKVGHPMGQGPLWHGASRRFIMEAAHASLRRLQIDAIDLYQIHDADPATPVEETLRALDDLVRNGDVRYVGTSNFTAAQLVEATHTAQAEQTAPLVSAQIHYNLLQRGLEREVIPTAARLGMGIIPYFPLAGGFLTGKYQPDSPVPSDSRLAASAPRFNTLSDTNFDRLNQLRALAEARGHTLAELASAWLLAQPSVSTVIAGARTIAQLEENTRAFDWRLTSEDLAAIDAICPPPVPSRGR
jgi:aryl-alcohol dehydrogenase-like predicted oxidoreductase